MRKLILLMLLSVICSLGAWISNPVSIINEDARVMFAGESAVVYKNGNIYLTYLQKGETHNYVMLSKSFDRGNTFVHTLVDSVAVRDNCFAPALSVSNNNTCFVYYQKGNELDLQSDFMCAKVLINNEISYTLISSYVTQSPLLLKDDNYTNIYFQKNIKKQLCNFMYFLNNQSSNILFSGVLSKLNFCGSEIFDGPVHINEDIYLENIGTGDNSGWTTFFDRVTSSGRYRYNTNSEMFPHPPQQSVEPELVFRDGLVTNCRKLEVDFTLPTEGVYYPFGEIADPEIDIVKVELIGDVFSYRLGNIVEVDAREFTVYSSYPDAMHPNTPIGDSLWTNYISIPDTIWTEPQIQSIPENAVIYIPSVLWIKGTVSGKQTWISKESTYIIGDISYTQTLIGNSPLENESDYFGLISQKSIIVKYKYRIDGEPLSYDNSEGPNGHLYLYGAFAALGNFEGDNDADWRKDGVFTFEYQHPHGAPTDFIGVSPYTNADTLYSFIDFHKYQFTPTAETPYWKKWPFANDTGIPVSYPYSNNNDYPWYGTTDWPWINPVWPEKNTTSTNNANPNTDVIYRRGTIHVWGSIAQVRRGYLYRYGQINEVNPDLGSWDPDNYQFGPTHPFTGYISDFHYDYRMTNSPLQYFASYLSLEGKPNSIKYDTSGNIETCDSTNSELLYYKYFISKDNNSIAKAYIVAGSDSITYEYSVNNGADFTRFSLFAGIVNFPYESEILDFKLHNNFGYLIMLTDSWLNNRISVFKLDLVNQNYTMYSQNNFFSNNIPFSNLKASLVRTSTGKLLLSYYKIIKSLNDSTLVWNLVGVIDNNLDIRSSTIVMDESDSLFLFVNTTNTDENTSKFDKLYFCKGYLNGITPVTDHPVPAVEPFYAKNYPNPFNPSTTIEFNLPVQVDTKLEIFNIKGQRVTTLLNNKMEKGLHKVVWNGTNSAKKSVGSGIYFYKLEAGNNIKMQKLLLLK